MIKAKTLTNTSCVKCNCVKKDMILIGSIPFCNKCYVTIFGVTLHIDKETPTHELYKVWLSKWYAKCDKE